MAVRVLVLALLAAACAACGSSSSGSDTTTTTTGGGASSVASDNGCKQVDKPAAKANGGQKPPDKPLGPNEHPELVFDDELRQLHDPPRPEAGAEDRRRRS